MAIQKSAATQALSRSSVASARNERKPNPIAPHLFSAKEVLEMECSTVAKVAASVVLFLEQEETRFQAQHVFNAI